jgi:hypothetical protein
MKLLLFLMLYGMMLLSCENNKNDIVRLDAINRSLNNSNETVQAATESIVRDLDVKSRDPRYNHVAGIWHPVASSIKKLTVEMNQFLDTLKSGIKEADHIAFEQLFKKDGKGKELYERLLRYDADIFQCFSPEKFIHETFTPVELKNDVPRLKQMVPINLALLKDPAIGGKPMNAVEWNAFYFDDVTCPEALTMLNKIQADILITENELIKYCDDHAELIIDSYDKYSVIIAQNSSCVKKGQWMEITAGVGAFSISAEPKITCNGIDIPLGDGGAAVYRVKADGNPGNYSIPVKVEFVKPDGTRSIIAKKIRYTIAD